MWSRSAGINSSDRSDLIHTIHDFYLHLKAAGRASSTIHCYCRDLKLLAKIIGNINVQQINAKHLENAIIKLCDNSHNNGLRSVATVNRIKSTYRSFFKWSFETGRIPINPAAFLHLTKTNSQRTIPISIEEINCLLEEIGKSNDLNAGRDEALFATYAFTGIRRSEALAIKLKDYDSRSKTLFLPKTKRGNNYMPPVPSRLAEILDKRIFNLKKNSHNIACLPFFSGRSPKRPLSARQAHARFDKWKQISGIRKNLTIHSFRSGYATLLYKTTRDLLLVALALGHQNINTTERYVKNNILDIREAVEKMYR